MSFSVLFQRRRLQKTKKTKKTPPPPPGDNDFDDVSFFSKRRRRKEKSLRSVRDDDDDDEEEEEEEEKFFATNTIVGQMKKGISSSMTMLFAVALASLATRASAESTDDSGDAVAPFFGFMGAASALVFSCVGAAYGTAKSGVGIASMGVMRPGTRAAAAFRSENRIAYRCR